MTKHEIQKIADMCKLTLSDVEATKLTHMFSETLEKMAVLSELDVSKVSGTYHVTGLSNVYRAAEVAVSGGSPGTLSSEEALKNAHETVRGYFATKGVFERSF